MKAIASAVPRPDPHPSGGWATLHRYRLAAVGLALILLLVASAVLAPWLAPYSPYDQDLQNVLAAPDRLHWLGTDNLGRDLLSRLLYGGRVSLTVGLVSTGLAALIGVAIGLAAGFAGGAADALLMRFTDAVLCFPALIFVLALSTTLGPGVRNVMISLVLFGWVGFARIVRGQVLLVRELPYVQAAQALGMRSLRIAVLHVLPNALPPVIVAASVGVGGAILVESGASFLGLGVQPPTASWGKELRTGFTYLELAPLLSLAPGVLITLAVAGFNFLGDGLRDALDPRLRRSERM